MKAALLTAPGEENLAIVDLPTPEPGPGEVLVRVKAVSLNYRDLLVVRGGYGSRQKTRDLIPLSDGAGEVVGVGSGVTRFKPGDRVVASFFRDFIAGEPSAAHYASALGGAVDGMAAEYRVLPAHGLALSPPHLDDAETATLACAGVTAWSAIIASGNTKPGDVVLTQGTGGVSLFALQFAKLAGATVIATSSSDAKRERVEALGADHTINYASTPDWGREARRLSGGRGVDHVVELGGAATLAESIRAVRPGGTISLIGVLGGAKVELPLPLVVMGDLRLQGITVGSRERLEAMIRAVAAHGLKPVVDRVFPLAEIHAAMAYLRAGRHFGKVCLSL